MPVHLIPISIDTSVAAATAASLSFPVITDRANILLQLITNLSNFHAASGGF